MDNDLLEAVFLVAPMIVGTLIGAHLMRYETHEYLPLIGVVWCLLSIMLPPLIYSIIKGYKEETKGV